MDLPIEGGNGERKEENWSVYRDAFAPSHTTKPKPRPWERAAVSAHAPRLVGQKIWKKASSLQSTATNSSKNQDKENAVKSQLELETEGKGARKRRRGMGGKDNIGDATWLVVGTETGGGKGGGLDGLLGEGSPRKGGRMRDEDAMLVPKKRTNANLMITPRKALQTIQRNTLAPALLLGAELYTAKSPERATKIQRNDLEVATQEEREKPGRRKSKSMRKSRRLTKSDLVDEVVEERRGSFVFGQTGGNGIESFSGVDQLPEPVGAHVEDNSAGTEEGVDSQQSSSALAATSALLGEAAEVLEPVTTQPSTEPMHVDTQRASPVSRIDEKTLQTVDRTLVQQAVESELETSSDTEEASRSFNERLEKHFGLKPTVELPFIKEGPVQTVIESEDTILPAAEIVRPECLAEQPPQTPVEATQFHVATLESVEPSLAITLSPTNFVATSRSRRKTPQRSVMRRSTRTTRNSSMSRGEASTHLEPPNMVDSLREITDAASSSLSVRKHSVDFEALEDTVASSHQAALITEDVNAFAETPPELVLAEEQPLHSEAGGEAVQESETADNAEKQPEEVALFSLDSVDEEPVSMETEVEEDSQQDSCNEQLQQELDISSPRKPELPSTFDSLVDEPVQQVPSSDGISEDSAENFELIEPISINNAPHSPIEETTYLQESSTPDPTTTELTEMISTNAVIPPTVYDQDDTDLLRNFLSKVKANKALKAESSIPKRKRSLPHSPLQIPLGTVEAEGFMPSPTREPKDDEFDVSLPTASPAKRRRRNENEVSVSRRPLQEDDTTELEPQSIRRSNRTHLPIKAAPAAPSFIPVRRLGGHDGENSTVTLRQNEEKELAALTRVNTRKNKKGASHPLDWLAKKEKAAEKEKEDPASKHKALKEVFDEKNYKPKPNKKGMSVVWAEELVEFQGEGGNLKKTIVPASVMSSAMTEKKVAGKEVEKEKEKEKERPILPGDEKKSALPTASISTATSTSKPSVKVGIRSKMTLGMAANGTPAPKRKARRRP
ncbi:uncharacterized protein RSE6_05290 [Rhynchosporium secalis]|uniref:Uncharacterized protein n=1 Tax=Rhynchosporium secalis TaxID=38038 RepID=A0A1E1M7G3_RHYSE|nr:uncharacterized protein RSE6_05290 [Rhynchosporium secalis]